MSTLKLLKSKRKQPNENDGDSDGPAPKLANTIVPKVFPYDPYHYRWKCPKQKSKWQNNSLYCSHCICYVCGVTMQSGCRVNSHKWAVPARVATWEMDRGMPETLDLDTCGEAHALSASSQSLLCTVRLTVSLTTGGADCLAGFGVPSPVV